MSNTLAFQINELQFLHSLCEHPEKMLDIKRNYLISSQGRMIYDVMRGLASKNLSLTKSNILSAFSTVDREFNLNIIEHVFATEIDSGAFETYFETQKQLYAKDNVHRILTDTIKKVASKATVDPNEIGSMLEEAQDCLFAAEDDEDEILLTAEAISKYKETIQKRIDGIDYHTSGCAHLDDHLPTGFAPCELTTIFGSTGVGKSTFK